MTQNMEIRKHMVQVFSVAGGGVRPLLLLQVSSDSLTLHYCLLILPIHMLTEGSSKGLCCKEFFLECFRAYNSLYREHCIHD